MKFHIQTWGCQMNDHDGEKLSGLLSAEGLRSGGIGGRRRAGAAQHLLHPREGRAQGLFRAGPPARGEAAASPAGGRHGLPGPAGAGRPVQAGAPYRLRAGHHGPQAAAATGGRGPGGPGPGHGHGRIPGQPPVPAGRHAPPGHGQGPGHDHGGLQPRLHLLHRAHHPRRRAPPPPCGCAGRGAGPGRAGLSRGGAAGPEREQLCRGLHLRGAAGAGVRGGRPRMDPLHHQPSHELHRRSWPGCW